MIAARSDALVFFGATGDLVYKKIFPALQEIARRSQLNMPVVGVARTSWTLEEFTERAKASIEEYGNYEPAAFEKLAASLRYVSGDYADTRTFIALREALGGAIRPLYYLAIPPSMFTTVINKLAESGCADGARIVVEKPFGHDLASAQALNKTLLSFFPEESIFRIDHFLGKEPVQNLVYFRFANPIVEASWNHTVIESVQITMAESFGIASRGKFYEETGAIRDVLQNHLLQVVACLAMECPRDRSAEALRDERARLLKDVRTLNQADIVRGQYDGYRSEPNVAPDSQVETFVAACFHIDNPRWAETPFYVRSGKRLPLTVTEIFIKFKCPEEAMLTYCTPQPANYYRFRISPDVMLGVGVQIKKPGELLVGKGIELIAHHQHPGEMTAYERLLSDAINGDPALFARQDAVEASWRIVNPILGNVTNLYGYEPGSWGPRETQEKCAPTGGWHNPVRSHSRHRPRETIYKTRRKTPMTAIQTLRELGQSLWLDYITRSLLTSGGLHRYIQNFGITGLTSNPTIFAKAFKNGEYDADIARNRRTSKTDEEIFTELAVADLKQAAHAFLSVYNQTDGLDGWVSLEVSPLLAYKAAETSIAVKNLVTLAAEPNLFIKIPGTKEGLVAIEEAIFAGIPINVTLLFSREQYIAAAQAYLRGIERRVEAGLNPRVNSVASIFVSRWDVAVAEKTPPALHNKLGIAIAERAYAAYLELLNSAPWRRLANFGARPQRLLWASTGTKDPQASKTLYVEALVAPLTINTMPEDTIKALVEHSPNLKLMPEDGGDCETVLAQFAEAGIDITALAKQLQEEGAQAFVHSWNDLMGEIADKRLSSAVGRPVVSKKHRGQIEEHP